jgi:hypothetical protein
MALFFLAASAVFALLAVGYRSEAKSQDERSAYTQAHGARREATVDSVSVATSAEHRYPQPGDFRSEVSVTLDQPVAGQATTTVHVPGDFSQAIASQFTVLVDPRDPGYAEEPGRGYPSSHKWIWWAFGAAVLGLIGLGCAVRAVVFTWIMRDFPSE